MTVKYFPTGVQILTGGSDRKVCYWEILDGSLVREIEASTSGAINTLDISPSGEFFVTGGNDQLVKLWRYQEGKTTYWINRKSTVFDVIIFGKVNTYVRICNGEIINIFRNYFISM